jgi:hypothetical protein
MRGVASRRVPHASWLAAIVEWSVSHAVGRLVWCTGMVRPRALCVGTADVGSRGRSSVVRCMLLARGSAWQWSALLATRTVPPLAVLGESPPPGAIPPRRRVQTSAQGSRSPSTHAVVIGRRTMLVYSVLSVAHAPQCSAYACAVSQPDLASARSGNFRKLPVCLGPATRTDRSTHLG